MLNVAPALSTKPASWVTWSSIEGFREEHRSLGAIRERDGTAEPGVTARVSGDDLNNDVGWKVQQVVKLSAHDLR